MRRITNSPPQLLKKEAGQWTWGPISDSHDSSFQIPAPNWGCFWHPKLFCWQSSSEDRRSLRSRRFSTSK